MSFCNWKELAVSVKSFDEIKGIVENAVPDRDAQNDPPDCNGILANIASIPPDSAFSRFGQISRIQGHFDPTSA